MLKISRLLPIISFIIVLAVGCNNDEGPVSLNATQVKRLLASDSSKTWRMVSLEINGEPIEESCNNFYFLEFIAYGSGDAEVKKLFHKRPETCPGEDAPLNIEGTWDIVSYAPIIVADSIIQIFGNQGVIQRIDRVTSRYLTLRYDLTFNGRENQIIEQYINEPQ